MDNISAKKVILGVLAAIGAAFLLAFLGLLLYIAIAKPFGIKIQNIPAAIINSQDQTPESSYDHPLLTTEQESTLEALGVDTRSLPTSITSEDLACFTEKLGAQRVQEIQQGATVTSNDYFKARACVK